MKPGEFASWLKSAARYAKITALRINGDDDRTIALNASAKRFATAEKVVGDIPGVQVVEALDGQRNIVSTFVVADASAERQPGDIEKSSPESPAGLMAAYARHVANAYEAGGAAVSKSYEVSFAAMTQLVGMLADRLSRQEAMYIRTLNAQAAAVEAAQQELEDARESGGGGLSLEGILAARLAAGKEKPNGAA